MRTGRRAGAGSGRAAAVFALVAVASCAPPEPAGPPPNVVLVMVDTLRARNLDAYGYERETAPNLTAFAADALLFEDARAQAPCTFPSANSLLTGRDGTAFWIQEEARIGIPEEIPSLAEILGARGYTTLAVSASPIVRASPSEHNLYGGFGRGFEAFDERCLWQGADCVNRRAFESLDGVSEPFFLYLHYMDPHDPYRPPERRWSQAPYEGKEFVAAGDPNPIEELLYGDGTADFEVTADDLRHLTNLYDDEIAYFDGRFGELLASLRERGLLERTAVALVADHGEEFLEHDQVKHCRSVYDTEIHTPLVVRLPGVEGGRRLGEPVQNLDLVPTLLDYLGIEADGLRLDGRSLRPLIEDGEPVHEHVFSAWGSLRAVKAGRLKLVMDLATGEAELYDLARDPEELHDVAGSRPREVRRLQHALSRWIREVERAPSEDEALRRGHQAAERLRALGYVQ